MDDRAETRGVTTLSLKGPIRDAATIVFTPEQIEEFCKTADDMCAVHKSRHCIMLDRAVRIIKQLQNQARGCKLWAPVGIDDLSGRVYPSATGPEGQG